MTAPTPPIDVYKRQARDEAAKRVKEESLEDSETAIMDAKYGFIHGALDVYKRQD